MCYALRIRIMHHSAAPARGRAMDYALRIRIMYQAPEASRRELWTTHYVSVLCIKRRKPAGERTPKPVSRCVFQATSRPRTAGVFPGVGVDGARNAQRGAPPHRPSPTPQKWRRVKRRHERAREPRDSNRTLPFLSKCDAARATLRDRPRQRGAAVGEVGWGGVAWRGAPRLREIARDRPRSRGAARDHPRSRGSAAPRHVSGSARWMGWERGGGSDQCGRSVSRGA